MVVAGFVEERPKEYAVEMNGLIELNLVAAGTSDQHSRESGSEDRRPERAGHL